MNYTEAIKKRVSVRSYEAQFLNPDIIEKIKSIISIREMGPFGSSINIGFIEKEVAQRDHQVKLGTYGLIKNAAYFICGFIQQQEKSEIDFGYLFEKVLLDLTKLGLGTCWLGGTFKRSDWSNIMDLEDDHYIPAISPVGFPLQKIPFQDKLIRNSIKADARKPWEHLFKEGDFGTPLSPQSAGDYREVLEMLRIGPSASNKQPWRVIKNENTFHLILQRTKGYGIPAVDVQMLDMGIAMCHFELTARESGLKGSWQNLPPAIKLPDHCEYIQSWQVK